jgi:hypothetical protein
VVPAESGYVEPGGMVPAESLLAGETSGLHARVGRRWQELDPLLPAPEPLTAGCGSRFTVSGPDGQLAAAGSCTHWEGEPGSLDLTWGAARRFQLTVQIAGPDVGGALAALLGRWREHLRDVPAAATDDSAAVVDWPARDIDGAAALLRHGFAPLAVVAARVPRPAPPGQPGLAGQSARPVRRVAGSGVRLRRAGPADIDAVVGLGLEVIRFDAHFGGVTERPSTRAALAEEAAGLLADPQPWVWLAERDGAPVGLLAAETPARAQWIAPMTGLAPVAYLLLGGVRAGERAGGVGAALTALLAAETRAAHVPVTLLHYALVNPLSAPFWSQQGYRPLWTCWEARPAAAVQ